MRTTPLLALALAAGLASCGGDDLVLPSEGEPAGISVVAGDKQSGRVGEALADPIVVEVSDAGGRPVSGAMVEFSFNGAPDTVPTGSDGRASIELALGSEVGAATGRATVVSPEPSQPLEATFTATAVPASANGLSLESGDGQTAGAGAPLPDPLVVSVADAFGNPVEGVAVTWAAVGGGSVSEASTVTDAGGLASVTRTLGPSAGTQHTTASAEGLAGSPVTFIHTATAGSAAGVQIVSGNEQSAEAGSVLPDPLVVEVTDADGNPVNGAAVTWVVTGGGGSLDPATSTTGEDGRASTQWTLGSDPGPNTARGVVSGVGQAEFTATGTGTGTASKLGIRTQPSDEAIAGVPFGRQPALELRDAAGHRVRQGGVAVTAAVAAGSGRLAGTATRITGSDGRVAFTDLAIIDGTGDHTLIFAASGYTSVVSEPIDVRPPANGVPTAGDDQYTAPAGAPLTVAAPGVLANDTDPEGARLTAVVDEGPENGTLDLRTDGSFDYTPATGFSGDDSFTYRAGDGTGSSAPATVRITVEAAVNQPPSFVPGLDQTVSILAGAQTVTPWATDISAGPGETGQTVVFIVTVQTGAELFAVAPQVSGDGTLTYTPIGLPGTATATVVAQDDGGTANGGSDTSAPHTITFSFTP